MIPEVFVKIVILTIAFHHKRSENKALRLKIQTGPLMLMFLFLFIWEQYTVMF